VGTYAAEAGPLPENEFFKVFEPRVLYTPIIKYGVRQAKMAKRHSLTAFYENWCCLSALCAGENRKQAW
jgi:hypothetical protein